MSFAGHVADMVRRNKQNREMLKEHHERMKFLQKKMHEGNLAHLRRDITVEELELIEKEIKDKELQDQRFYVRFTLVFLGIILLAAVLFWGIYTLFI